MLPAAHTAENLLVLLQRLTERRLNTISGYTYIATLGKHGGPEIVFCTETDGQVAFTLERPAAPFSFILYKNQPGVPTVLMGYSTHQEQTSLLPTILTIFTAVYKQSAHFQIHQAYPLYEQLYRLLRPDPLLIKSSALLDLLEYSSHVDFPATTDKTLIYRHEMGIRRYFSNILHLWSLEASNLLNFTQGPCIYHENNKVTQCAYGSVEYSVFIPQIKSFVNSMRGHIRISGFSYNDCFNLGILEKLAQTASLFSFILIGSQKHSHLLSIKRHVDHALDDKTSTLYKMIIVLAKANSNVVGEFNRLSYFSQKQASALKSALQLAIALLPYILIMHRVSTSFYHIVQSDTQEELSLDLLGNSVFDAIYNIIHQTRDQLAYDLIAYSLSFDITLIVQHAIGPDHLFVTDILLYRRNVSSALQFLDKLKAILPDSPKLTSRISQLRLRCQDLLDLSMWQYQYNTALNTIKTGIYEFPPSLLIILEEVVKTILLFIPEPSSAVDAECTSNFTYALTLLPTEESFERLPLVLQCLDSAHVISSWPQNLVNSSTIDRLNASASTYPICGRYKPANTTEQPYQRTTKLHTQSGRSTFASRPVSGRKRPILKLTLDVDDLQSSDTVDMGQISGSFSRIADAPVKSSAVQEERRLFKYNHPKRKLIIKSITLAVLFTRNFQSIKQIIYKADCNCVHSISVGLQCLSPNIFPASDNISHTPPSLPLQLGRHIIAVRTLLERQTIFSEIAPLISQFILTSNRFFLYVKHNVLKTSFNVTSLDQYYSCILFIEHYFKNCIILAYMLCCFGTVLLRLIVWKTAESPLLSTVTEEFINRVGANSILETLLYLSTYILEIFEISPSTTSGGRLIHYEYKHITMLSQKLPCPELLTFLWLFDSVFSSLKSMRDTCYCTWSTALNQTVDVVHDILTSVPISILNKVDNLTNYVISNIGCLPEFIRSCHLYQINTSHQMTIDFDENDNGSPFYLLCDLLDQKYGQHESFRSSLFSLKVDILNHGSTVKNGSWILPPVTLNLSTSALSLFQFCISASIIHKHMHLDYLLNEHSKVHTRLRKSHLWSLAKEQCTQIDNLLTKYLSNPTFIWQEIDVIQQFLQDFECSIQALVSYINTLSAITTNIHNGLLSYTPALEKRVKLPITQPLAPLSEFLASSRSWSPNQLPDALIVHLINDILSLDSEAGDTSKYFLPRFTETIQYHEYLSFGSMVLTELGAVKDNTDDDSSNRQVNLFVKICNLIEERIYLFKKSIENQLDSYCKELELLHASTDLSDEFLFGVFNEFSLTLHELTVIWMLYLYLLCSPKTPPLLHVSAILNNDSLHTCPALGTFSEVNIAVSSLISLLVRQKQSDTHCIPPELENAYRWAEKLIFIDPFLYKSYEANESENFLAAFQTVTGRLTIWVASVLQIPLLINRVLERFPRMKSYVHKLNKEMSKSALFDQEYSILCQYIPSNLLFSEENIIYYYKFDGLLFYIARVLFLCHSKGYEQFDCISSIIAASHTQLSNLKQSEDIVLLDMDIYQSSPLFLENLLSYLVDILRIQSSIDYIPNTKQFNKFFAEFLRFKSFITEKESQLGVITCGLYLLRSVGLSDPLISRASTIVKDLSSPILSNLYHILNLYQEALIRVEKECYTHLKHAMGQIDDSRSLAIEYRYYPIIPSTLEPAALIRTIHLLRSIFKIDSLKKLYEQINNKSQILILYMQKNNININSTFKQSTEAILTLQGAINISYEKVKYLVDSTRTSLLAYTISANNVLMTALHDCISFATLDQRESLDSNLQHAIKQNTLTGPDIHKLYIHSSRILLFLEDSLVRIRHIYSKLCYHYELCYLEGAYGSDVFVKTAHGMLDFIRQNIEGTEFPGYLRLITAYQIVWGKLCQVTDMLLRYVDKPLTVFYENYHESMALIRDVCTLRKHIIVYNTSFADFLNWYESILHTLQEQLLSANRLQNFTSEQWQDLIYHIGHITKDSRCMELCNLDGKSQLTFGDILFLKLNTHPDIMRGKMSMALVSSVILTKVSDAISHWSKIKGNTFITLVRELSDIMECTILNNYLLTDSITECKNRYFSIEQYFKAYDTVSVSIIQKATEKHVRSMIHSASVETPNASLLLEHLDVLKSVAEMECSERSFPMLTCFQIYLRTLLDVSFITVAVLSGLSLLCNCLIVYSYIGSKEHPDVFTDWIHTEDVSDCLNIIVCAFSIHKHILSLLNKDLYFKQYLLSNSIEDCNTIEEHIEAILAFLQKQTVMQIYKECFSTERFNLFCKHIANYLESIQLSNLVVTLYQSQEPLENGGDSIKLSSEGSRSYQSAEFPRYISLYSLSITLFATVQIAMHIITNSITDTLAQPPIEQPSELFHVAQYAIEEIKKVASSYNIFGLFSRGINTHITIDVTLSLSKIDVLLNGLISRSIYFINQNHAQFLLDLSQDTDIELALCGTDANVVNCSLFRATCLSNYYSPFLSRLLSGYQGLIMSSEDSSIILGYLCGFPDKSPMIFYRPINLCTVTKCIFDSNCHSLHPLWLVAISLFNTYEETLRIGSLLALRELRAFCSLSLSVDLCTNPSANDEDSAMGVYLTYGYSNIDLYHYEFIPFQAMYIGIRLFLSALCLFLHDYTGKETITSSTNNEFLVSICGVIREYTCVVNELPLKLLATTDESDGEIQVLTRLADLPSMQWKNSMLLLLFEDFCDKLNASEIAIQTIKDKALDSGRTLIDPDFISKDLLRKLMDENVLFLQMEFSIFPTRATSILNNIDLSFTPSKTASRDTMYSITSSDQGHVILKSLFAQIALTIPHLPMVDAIRVYSPTLSVTKSYLSGLLEAASCPSMLAYGLQLISSMRSLFQTTLFLDGLQNFKNQSIQLFINNQAQQTIMEIASILCFSNSTNRQTSTSVLSVHTLEPTVSVYLLSLVSIDYNWVTLKQQGHMLCRSEYILGVDSLTNQPRIYSACVKIATLIKDFINDDLTCKNLERAFAKYFYNIFAGTNIDPAEQSLYLSIDELLRNFSPLSLNRAGVIMEYKDISTLFDSRVFALHAQSILQQMVSIDLDERLLQCMDPLIDWLFQLIMKLRYIFIVNRYINAAVLYGPVFSYVYILPWIFYRVLISFEFPATYYSKQSGDLIRENQKKGLLTIYSHRLLPNESIENVISSCLIGSSCHRAIHILTVEELTVEQRSFCQCHGIPILNTVRPIADANDFKHLELLSLYTNLYAWCHPTYPKINGIWHIKPSQPPSISSHYDIESNLDMQKRSEEIQQKIKKSPESFAGSRERLERIRDIHFNITHQRKLLAPRIVHSFIEISGVYRDLVEKAVTSNELCSYYRYHAITGALSIVLAILDALMMDASIRANILRLETKYFHAIIVFSCSWVYASLPIRSYCNENLVFNSSAVASTQPRNSLYINTSIRKSSPLLLKTAPPMLHTKQITLDSTQISWPVFLSNALGSLVLTKIGCFASNIYDFVPAIRVECKVINDTVTTEDLTLEHISWPEIAHIPNALIPQIVVMLCQLYTGERLISTGATLSHNEFSILGTYISDSLSAGVQTLPIQRCLEFLRNIFVLSNARPTSRSIIINNRVERRLTPLQVMHCIPDPFERQSDTKCGITGISSWHFEGAEFCPLIVATVPIFTKNSHQQYKVYTYTKTQSQILCIFDHHRPKHHMQQLYCPQSMILLEDTYNNSERVDSYFSFMTPRINSTIYTLATQIFLPLSGHMSISCDHNIYVILIQLTLQIIQDYKGYTREQHSLDSILAILSPVQSMLEGFALNEKITRKVFQSLAHEEPAFAHDPVLTPRLAILAWLLSAVDFYASCFSKSLYDDAKNISFNELKEFYGSLLSLASFKANKFIDTDTTSTLNSSVKSFGTMELIEFYKAYPLFAICLGHNNLFLPLRLRSIPSFPIRAGTNTMTGVLSYFSMQLQKLDDMIMTTEQSSDPSLFLRFLSLQEYQNFLLANNTSLPLLCPTTKPSKQIESSTPTETGILCTRAAQCINFTILCDLFSNAQRVLHSSSVDSLPLAGTYMRYSHISMPAFRVGVILHHLSLLPISQTEGISSHLTTRHLRNSKFVLTEPGQSLKDALAYACNLRGLIYPLEVIGLQKTEDGILLELAKTLSMAYMLIAWMRKPICIFVSSYAVQNAKILKALVSLLSYGYSPEIMGTLTVIEQYTLARKILGLLYDSSYSPETVDNAVFKDFSSIADGPLERIGTLQISDNNNPALVKLIRSSGLRRFLNLVALAHFSIPFSSSHGRDATQSYTSQLKLKRIEKPPITLINTLSELLCSPIDVLATNSTQISLSSLLNVYVDVPIYSEIHSLLKMAHYNHIYTSNLVFAMPPVTELNFVEEILYKELSSGVPSMLQDILDDQECLKLAKVYMHIVTYLSEALDRRLLFSYISYPMCVEFGTVMKSLLYHRKHTFTVRQKHYDLALTNLQLVHENSEQALESCRRASAEIQAHSLAFQNTNFEISHIEEDILMVKQRLCVRTNDKKYAEKMLAEALELQTKYKKQTTVFHKQMDRISDYQNSVNPILFAANWQIHKRFQECLSMACLHLAACSNKKVSVFALSVPKKDASKHAAKNKEPILDTFKRRVSNIDVFIKEMIAPSPEEIVNSSHYQIIINYLTDAIESISGYRHRSSSYLIPIENVKVEKEVNSGITIIPKEISKLLPPFYTKEKAHYIPSEIALLNASVKVRDVHIIADMLLWILFFQMELCNTWLNGAEHRKVISDQTNAIASCTSDISSLEQQLVTLESRLLLGQERKRNLDIELTNLRNKYKESKDMLSTTSSILSSISDLRQAWLGASLDLKIKLDNILGDSIVIATAYTMLLHVSSNTRCKYLSCIAHILADVYDYAVSPIWTENGLSDSCITKMTLSNNELMQIQYAALTSHFFAPQAPLYERDLNIILSNTNVEVSGDINVSEDEWLGLINCFGSLTEIEADILRHGSTLIHETFVFYVTALLFGHRSVAILVTDQTIAQGRLLSEIVAKVSMFQMSNNGCTRPIFLQTLADCQRLYSAIHHSIVDSINALKCQIHDCEQAIASVAESLHADVTTSETQLTTLKDASVILPVALDLTSMTQTSIEDVLLGVFQLPANKEEGVYEYVINRQSASIEALYNKPDKLTTHNPIRAFMISLRDKQDVVLTIANNQLLSFCSIIDLEPIGYRANDVSTPEPTSKIILQRPMSNFIYLDYTGDCTIIEKPPVSTYRVDSQRIYQEVSLCGYVLSNIDESIVDFMCTLQSNADTLNTLTNKMLQLVLSSDKVPFLEAIAEVHCQMKLVAAMVIRLKKCLFLKIHVNKTHA